MAELDLRWVSCSRDVSWSASLHRHLIAPGALTTVCGNTASHPEVWRGNSTKPDCPACANHLQLHQPLMDVHQLATNHP